jgi:hypothetical protein
MPFVPELLLQEAAHIGKAIGGSALTREVFSTETLNASLDQVFEGWKDNQLVSIPETIRHTDSEIRPWLSERIWNSICSHTITFYMAVGDPIFPT